MDLHGPYADGRNWLSLRPWQRHSLVLAVAGFVYIALGLIYCLIPLTPERASGLRLALRASHGMVQPWGVAWLLVGGVALVSTRWPPRSKTWGYTALTALSCLWAAVYGLGTLMLGAPKTGYSGALVWSLVAFMWWAISGLTNPDDNPQAE